MGFQGESVPVIVCVVVVVVLGGCECVCLGREEISALQDKVRRLEQELYLSEGGCAPPILPWLDVVGIFFVQVVT